MLWFEARHPGRVHPAIRPRRRSIGSTGASVEWKVRYWRQTGDRPQPRQLALLVGVPAAGAIAAAVVATGSSRRRLAVLGAAAAAAAFVELRGSAWPKGGLAVHGTAAAALAAVGAGWLRGAWGELLTPRGASVNVTYATSRWGEPTETFVYAERPRLLPTPERRFAPCRSSAREPLRRRRSR